MIKFGFNQLTPYIMKRINVLLLFACFFSNGNAQTMQVYLRQFCCDKTTEAGADEVYLIVTGRSSNGYELNVRKPGTNLHWDMNDGDQGNDRDKVAQDSHCITDRPVATLDIAEGETWNINIALCEEDGGTSQDYQQIASQLLIKIGDPFSVSAGVFLNALTQLGLFIRDTDDWMGMIGVKVTKRQGKLEVQYKGKDGIVSSGRDPDYPGAMERAELRMNHDGTNYVIWLGVR
jgi:hypothetical protein